MLMHPEYLKYRNRPKVRAAADELKRQRFSNGDRGSFAWGDYIKSLERKLIEAVENEIAGE